MIGCDLPRWFAEGHANWVSFHVAEKQNPEFFAQMEQELTNKTAAERTNGGPNFRVNLANWGGMMVKREAIHRQANAAEQAKMDADPLYTPVGPYQLQPGDITSDESNLAARYLLAWQLFGHLESQIGVANTTAMIQAVLQGGSCESDHLIQVIEQTHGVSVAEFFNQ